MSMAKVETLKKQMVVKTLIEAVARQPGLGSWVKSILALQGRKRSHKSEFFKALLGKEFLGPLNSQKDKDHIASFLHWM